MADEMTDELSVQIEQARSKVRDSLERAHELICEAKLALRQQTERELAENSPEIPD